MAFVLQIRLRRCRARVCGNFPLDLFLGHVDRFRIGFPETPYKICPSCRASVHEVPVPERSETNVASVTIRRRSFFLKLHLKDDKNDLTRPSVASRKDNGLGHFGEMTI